MDQVRIGIVSWTATYWPFYVGLHASFFEQEGLSVQLVALGSTSAGIPALLDREVDIAATCPDALIEAVADGAPLRIAGGLVNYPVSSLLVAPSVVSYPDLRGRRVAVTEARGSVSILLRALLRQNGLEAGDYQQVVCSTTPAQAAALERGEVDAAMLTHPFETPLIARGFRQLARVGEALGPCAFTTLNVRAGWTQQALWPRLLRALERADQMLRDRQQRTRVLQVLSDATGVAQGDLGETYALYVDAGQVLASGGRLDLRGLRGLLQLMQEDGLRAGPPDHADRYLDAAAAVA